MNFSQSLERGQLGESVIARWLISRGNMVLPVYEKEIDTGKGPRLFTGEGQLVAPDMLVLPNYRFIEAKHKNVFTWHRKTRKWVTGVDLNHYHDYQQVQLRTRTDVWLLFLHRSDQPDHRDLEYGCPRNCPVGLFGQSLNFLIRNENHRHENWGRHGMVYWSTEKLRLLSTIEDLVERIGSDLLHASR